MSKEAKNEEPQTDAAPSSESPESELPPPSDESVNDGKSAEIDPQVFVLNEKVKSLEAKVSDYEIKFIEARAYLKKLESEIQDIRQRAERDSQKAVDAKVSRFAADLLPTVDLFELSLKSAGESKTQDLSSFVKGIEMIYSQMVQALSSLGFVRIQTLNEIFDPHLHEAILNEPVKEPEKDGRVLREIKAGYRLGSLIVRPAQVVVGKSSEL